MPSRKPETIKDAEVRQLMERAERECEADHNVAAVRLYGDAYLLVLERFPAVRTVLNKVLAHPVVKSGLERGSIRNAPYMWPRYGAKLHVDDDKPSITIDRKNLSFSETVQYQEFMYDFIAAAEGGAVEYNPARIGPAQ